MITIPTEHGCLRLEETELLAASVRTRWDGVRTLQVVIEWMDTGEDFTPMIEIKDGWATVSIRKPPEPVAESLLDRANRMRDEIEVSKHEDLWEINEPTGGASDARQA